MKKPTWIALSVGALLALALVPWMRSLTAEVLPLEDPNFAPQSYQIGRKTVQNTDTSFVSDENLTAQQLDLLTRTAPNLTVLEIDLDMMLRELPASIQRLKSLRQLTLNGLREGFSISALAANKSLEHLKLTSLSSKTLPSGLENLRALRSLQIEASAIQTLPESLGNLPLLEFVELKKCHSLRQLPANLLQPPNMRNLHLLWCSELLLPLEMLRQSPRQLFSLQLVRLNWGIQYPSAFKPANEKALAAREACFGESLRELTVRQLDVQKTKLYLKCLRCARDQNPAAISPAERDLLEVMDSTRAYYPLVFLPN